MVKSKPKRTVSVKSKHQKNKRKGSFEFLFKYTVSSYTASLKGLVYRRGKVSLNVSSLVLLYSTTEVQGFSFCENLEPNYGTFFTDDPMIIMELSWNFFF